MLTSLFRKSTPLNYSLVIIAAVVFFFLYHFANVSSEDSGLSAAVTAAELTAIFVSLFMANFIVKKNSLSRDSTYTVLFYLIFTLFFPSLFDNFRLILANLFILLALRRLISLHSPKSTREKIFDASLWIFVATLFHFWAITYISLVFISILFHVSRDYRNWVLPFIACFAVAAVFSLVALTFDESLFESLRAGAMTDSGIDYFTNQKQNLALSAYAAVALFFTVSMLITSSNRPLQLQASYKKIIASFFIGVFIFVISPAKSNDLAIFSIAPLAFMGTAYLEYYYQDKLKQEIVLAVAIICGVALFFLQL